MRLSSAIKRCRDDKTLCFRPAAWAGLKTFAGKAFKVRFREVRSVDGEAVKFTGGVTLLLGDWEVLSLTDLRREEVELTTGVKV